MPIWENIECEIDPEQQSKEIFFSKLNICGICWNKSIISNRNPKGLYPKRICKTCIKQNKTNQTKQIKQRNYALLASNKTKQTKQIKWTNYVLTASNKTEQQQKTIENEQIYHVLPASNTTNQTNKQTK